METIYDEMDDFSEDQYEYLLAKARREEENARFRKMGEIKKLREWEIRMETLAPLPKIGESVKYFDYREWRNSESLKPSWKDGIVADIYFERERPFATVRDRITGEETRKHPLAYLRKV